jgi:hypothetical protein
MNSLHARYGLGILGFMHFVDAQNQSAVISIRMNQRGPGILLDIARQTRQGIANLTLAVEVDLDSLKIPDWLFTSTCTRGGTLLINGKSFDALVVPLHSHPGSALIDLHQVGKCAIIRHDCNPWPAIAYAAVIAVAASAAVITVAVTGYSVKVEASTSGVSVEIGPADGGDDGDKGESGGEGGGDDK